MCMAQSVFPAVQTAMQMEAARKANDEAAAKVKDAMAKAPAPIKPASAGATVPTVRTVLDQSAKVGGKKLLGE